jgi:hypothetical protein
MGLTRRNFSIGSALALGLTGLGSKGVQAADVTAAEARAIAKDAYIYGFPMVDGYRILHAYFVDRETPEFKGPWNQLVHLG